MWRVRDTHTQPAHHDKSVSRLFLFFDTAWLILKWYYANSSMICVAHVGVIQGCFGCSMYFKTLRSSVLFWLLLKFKSGSKMWNGTLTAHLIPGNMSRDHCSAVSQSSFFGFGMSSGIFRSLCITFTAKKFKFHCVRLAPFISRQSGINRKSF